jgi:hypothetical protein
VIGYMPNGDTKRAELAAELIMALPGMVVEALALCDAGLELTPNDLTVDIQEFHLLAHNKPSLEVVVMTGPGQNDRTYQARNQIRGTLRLRLLEWLSAYSRRIPVDLTDMDVDLRFVNMCGVNTDVSTHEIGQCWGGVDD